MNENLTTANIEDGAPVEKEENKVFTFVKKVCNGAVAFGKKIAKPVLYATLGAVLTKGVEYILNNRPECDEAEEEDSLNESLTNE